MAAMAATMTTKTEAPPSRTAPPVVAVEARSVGSTPAAPPEPFAASRTLARAPRLEGSGRLRLWALALQLVGFLAVVGAVTLLLFVLLA